MSFTPVVLTGKYSDGANPLQGTVTLTLSQVMSNDGVVVVPNSQSLTLDDDGEFSITLYANTDLNTVPYRAAWYQVTEQLFTENAQGQQRDYSIQIPAFDAPYTWSFNSGTTTGVVGPGVVAFNAVAYPSVTEMYVNVTDATGEAVASWIDGLVDGNVSVYNISTQNSYVIFNVTGYTVYGEVIILDVTYVTSNGSLDTVVGDLALGQPLTTIDISQLMPGTPMGFNPTQYNPSGTVQWTTYLDMPEVLAWLQFTGAPTVGSEQSGLLQRIIDSACYTAQDIANRPFAPTTMYERHDGWSGEYIQLNFSPVLKLIQCSEFQSTGGFIQLPESTPENPVEGVQVDYKTGQIMRAFAGYSWPRPFYPGSRNIEVTYVAGFDPIPHNVWLATIDLVSYWYRTEYQASRTFTPGQGPPPNSTGSGSDLWPGVPYRISTVFESYRLPVIG